MSDPQSLGAIYLGQGNTHFTVWAPQAQRVEVHIISPQERLEPLQADELGYHQATLDRVEPETLYFYRLDRRDDRPDPASRYQPQGVHGPSAVVDPGFPWTDQGWPGVLLADYVIYELHPGTFTDEGTFESIIPHLETIKELGVTVLELMPVGQFPGKRNWGYDGVNLFAAQNAYGGPVGLKRLVNACHQRGIAVALDVVYNHLGPEGNYLGQFGSYFTDRYLTPWGAALNFDGPGSDQVRRFFIENALYWITECHIDALRLDAVHAILDHSPVTFIEDLSRAVKQRAEELNRRVYLIAESADNDARLLRPPESGGYGLDAQWSDDFHHCLHTLLTGEGNGYYQDYGRLEHLARALRQGFAYTGEYSPFRDRKHGSPTGNIPGHRFVVCAQNHDQVGNRTRGERLGQLVPFESLKLAAGVLLLSPFVPLLFMGEEYGETAPFPYFIDHTDPELVEAVRRGRAEEFAAFQQEGSPPDPYAEATFQSALLNHQLGHQGQHQALWKLHQELIRLRQRTPALALLNKDALSVVGYDKSSTLFLRRWSHQGEVEAVFHFGNTAIDVSLPFPAGRWHKLLDSTEERWLGPGSSLPQELATSGEVTLALSPHSFVIYASG